MSELVLYTSGDGSTRRDLRVEGQTVWLTQLEIAEPFQTTKQDIIIAKNYLSEDEVDTLNRLVVIFHEQAELRAKQQKDLTLDFWRSSVDRMLVSNDQSLLRQQRGFESERGLGKRPQAEGRQSVKSPKIQPQMTPMNADVFLKFFICANLRNLRLNNSPARACPPRLASQVFEKGDPSRAERDRSRVCGTRRVNAGAVINNFIPDAGIQRIADTLIGWKEEEKLSRIVDHAELKKNDYKVSPSRYIHTIDAETYRPIAEIVEELKVIEAEARETDKALKEILKQLGV